MPSASVASSSGKALSPPLFTSDFDTELFEVLFETNLLQYYYNFAVDLKIYSTADLRNLTDSELELVGLNGAEIRRLRRLVKKDNGHKTFYRLRKKFSFRASSRMSFDASGDRLSLFNPSASHSGGSQDDSSSIFRAASSASNSLRSSARHISLSRCGPAPPLLALLDPDLITLLPTKILGEGEFATVYQGVLRKDALCQDKLTVAIKKFAPNCLGRPLHVFLQHIALLSDLRHSNLLHIFGCYTDEYCQPAIVCELATLRSLIDVFSDPDLRVVVSPMHLCRYAEQIASGMAYLERRRIVHGDLACRNIMLSNISLNAQVKIADYGLLKALGVLLTSGGSSQLNGGNNNQTPPSSSANSDDANSTSTDHSKLRLPVAWCAPETLRSVEMTPASDVWAFGVTLWEMFSFGEQPWSQLSATEILDAVDAPCGQRLAQPDFCPRDYYDDVMLRCWRHDATDRPTFAYLEQHMPLVRPDQVQTIKNSNSVVPVVEEEDNNFGPLLTYLKGEIFTVLDKRTGKQVFWKGITGDGCLGYFRASDVVFYTDLLVPSSGGEAATLRIAPTPPLLNHQNSQNNKAQAQNQGYLVISPPPPEDNTVIYQFSESNKKESQSSEVQASSKMPNDSKKHRFGGVIPSITSKSIDSSMISLPRGDLRHIGHIGFDGAVSGHVDFIAPGVERVCIERTSQSGTLQSLKRSDSFEDGFELPDLSLESEMQEIISTIRLSDFLAPSQPSENNVINRGIIESVARGSVSSFSQLANNCGVAPPVSSPQIESTQSMRQPRQPTGLLSNFDKSSSSPPPLTMAFIKGAPPTKELKVEPPGLSSLLPGSPSISTSASSSTSPSSSCSSGSSPCPPTSSLPTSSPFALDSAKGENSNEISPTPWRHVDSPATAESNNNNNNESSPTSKLKSHQEEQGGNTTLSSTANVTLTGQRRASIVTAEERQRVYEEVHQKCGHPLMMSDCLRAVSYTQGNVDAAVKFLKLQYLASHRIAEVERCKNALVACDWDVERALDMLRLRSGNNSGGSPPAASPPATATVNFLTTTPSDAVNV